jgi:hypothetical protein
MFSKRITPLRGAALVCISVQILTTLLPGFNQVLTQTERQFHLATTLSMVSLLITLPVLRRHPRMALAVMAFLPALLFMEELFIGTKTFLPFHHQRLACVLVLPIVSLALLSFLKLGARHVFLATPLRSFDHRVRAAAHRR